ncbi:MAG: adenylate/guanylate cyclase domain-containing protein [Desulfovibrionaceae bacterium]|nr:adenylate/guanylate cyclase domain-containing protein [Desulfovibrionaceae bacterium]
MALQLRKFFKSDQIILIVAGLLASMLLAVLYIVQPSILRFLDYKIYDHLLKKYHTTKTTGLPVIVDIDEKSLAELGQWPWPRYRVALLLARLRQAGVLAVGLDILFAEPDRTSPEVLKNQLKNELKVEISFQGLPKGLENNDQVLAEVLKKGPFVLGYNFIFDKKEEEDLAAISQAGTCSVRPIQAAVLGSTDSKPLDRALYSALGAVCPLAVLAEAAPQCGFFTTAPDFDGVLRRVPLLIHWQGKLYPSLALAGLLQATGKRHLLLKLSPAGVESLRLGKTVIPLDKKGQILVNWRGGHHSYPYISASDVLAGRAGPKELKDRIAFIGTSAAGLKDLRTTPFETSYPGVETHANIIDSIIARDFISIPDWAPGVEFMALLAAGLLTTLLLTWARAHWLVAPLLVLSYGMYLGCGYVFSSFKIYVSPLYSYLALGLNFSLITVLKFWREEKQKKFIQGAFSHYLAPAVISQILDNPGALTLDGQEKEVSIMFSDIRSFTSLSERLTPTQVTDLLRDYLTPMTAVITDNSGTLDKFIGDAVMAFWNAPLDVPGHQAKAVQSALEQLDKLEELNKLFLEKFGFTINIGLGIHCGTVRVGNMGSADLFDYTLIGDSVNLASRLEGLTKFYGQRIVVSADIAQACGEAFSFVELDRVKVKGKEKPITIYTVLTRDQAGQRQAEIKAYEAALGLYKAGNFDQAGQGFSSLSGQNPENPLYKLYQERCEHLIAEPPQGGWDGVFTHKTK